MDKLLTELLRIFPSQETRKSRKKLSNTSYFKVEGTAHEGIGLLENPFHSESELRNAAISHESIFSDLDSIEEIVVISGTIKIAP